MIISKKSKSDDRLYRYLRLQNNLRCLVVQDKDVEKSSACLHVGVGSLYDPPQANGLAHFLEHMLFLGTKKYPSENYYSQHIQQNGGQKNAATSENYTYYYFDVKNEAFPKAVDIFSQFFKEPLFTETATEREMNAVDSEYKKNLSDDGRRIFQMEKSVIVRPGSVLNKFSTGGMETLKHEGIRDELLKFHEDYYSSNIMRLVLVGRDSLENLEKLAVENFSDVVNKEVVLKDLSNEIVYDENSLGKLYKVVPHKNLKKILIHWNLPYSEHLWNQKPSSIISHLIGHEGPNSLLSQLIKEGLATSLQSSNSSRMDCIDQFSVSVGLTDKGEENYQRVVELVYQYINQLKQSGIPKYVFDEKKRMYELSFEYKTKQSAISYAQTLAARMLKFIEDEEFNDLLWRPHALEVFDPEELQRRMNLLTPQNSFVIFQSKKNEKEDSVLLKEKWYGTPYSIEKIPDDTISYLAKVLPSLEVNLGLPPRNEFIPQQLNEIKILRDLENTKPAFPMKISENPQVWFKQDDTFDQPFLQVNMKLQTYDCAYPVTALSQMFIVLWKACLLEFNRELSYMGSLAGIGESNGLSMEYLSWTIFSYNDVVVTKYIAETLKSLQNYDVTKEIFEDIKNLKIRSYENSLKSEPYQRIDSKLYTLIMKNNLDIPELLKALKEELDFETFVNMKNQWLRNLRIEWFVTGHITQKDAMQIVHDSEAAIKHRKITQEEIQEQRLIKLPYNYLAEYEELNADTENPNSAALAIYQYELKTPLKQAINSVLFQLLKEPFFNQLRTQQQLGYIVQCAPMITRKVIHGKFLVQSSVKDPDYLILKMNEFLLNIRDNVIPTLTDEQIETSKKAIINSLQQKDLNLGQEAGRYWDEILTGDYEFSSREIKIEALRQVQKQDVIEYFNELFFNNPKRLNLKFYSHGHFDNKDELNANIQANQKFYQDNCKIFKQEKIENYRQFKLSHFQFPRL
ncbi:insulin-degrading enzyme [Stylonychia lemnae]|uniref:Insulin-degrading enzyme n=1 Tax=Stylonychia lemnae TaxID=5949 RepID=A0A078ATE8_STYLE|nr:insulin-degrading enzyme [Stylonychia lemnae]|eukprot:CDW84143.1 insulin-degrading enzyme [Stylonychia lemnae]